MARAKLETVLDSDTSGAWEIDRWVCALGQCVPNIIPYLEPLLEQGREDKLMSFVELNMSAFTKGKLHNSFWHSAPDTEQQVRTWLNQERRIKNLLSDRYGMKL